MSLEETLRKSKEIDEKYKKYLKEKEQSDISWKITEKKIDATILKMQDTSNNLRILDKKYEDFQKHFSDMIDRAAQKLSQHTLLEKGSPNFQPNFGDQKKVGEILRGKKKVLVLTGAGMSAASGIPTFRDEDGYWTKKKQENVSPQQFLTLANFQQNPLSIWQWIDEFYCRKNKCKPNLGHACLDALCSKIVDKGGSVCIVTQNIDDFHRESQSSNIFKGDTQKIYPIYEIHGNILQIRCNQCSKQCQSPTFFPYSQFRKDIVDLKCPLCPKCENLLRPHIMFFDECYSEKYQQSDSVAKFTQDCDMVMVIGTALQTGLSRSLVEQSVSKKIDIVQINTNCIIRQQNTIWIEGKSDEFLVKMCNEYD